MAGASLTRSANGHQGTATGGRVLEPGMGTGLFFALLPDALRSTTRLTGIEYDPVTARIARFVHPKARVRCEDYTRSRLAGGFDLVIGNPPFADRGRLEDGVALVDVDALLAQGLSELAWVHQITASICGHSACLILNSRDFCTRSIVELPGLRASASCPGGWSPPPC